MLFHVFLGESTGVFRVVVLLESVTLCEIGLDGSRVLLRISLT